LFNDIVRGAGRAAAIRGDGCGASRGDGSAIRGDGSGDGMPLYKSHKAITYRFKPCIRQSHTSIAIYALYSCIKSLYALKSIYT
jgi:hypothetical protein